ncbi:MAG: hypothetical protein OXI87_24550 [Albidovulum sp.]|nr:hypothetical protein [Albidovulum sp.]MDE0533269.1 hypothetical protein [Albidovulum sp.]
MLASWSDDRYAFSQLRDKERNEAGAKIEDGLGRIAGVDAEASANVVRKDLSSLNRLANAVRKNFFFESALCDHEINAHFGERTTAVPVSPLCT